MKKLPFNLGSTLYSFNIQYYTYQCTFEQLIEKCMELGPNQGIEVVAPMFDRGYPRLSQEFEHRFKSAQEKYGFIPTCYSGYSDPQRFTGRYANAEEEKEYIKLQIDSAVKLGFPIVRLPWIPEITGDLLKYAEKYKIHIATEVHAPLTIETADVLVNDLLKYDSEYMGIVPDCGIFCKAPSEVYFKRFREQGVEQKYVDKIVEMWNDKKNQYEIADTIKDMGGNELAQLMGIEADNYFGHSEPESMLPLMKYIRHVHGKFFYINDDGEESAVRIPEIVDVLIRGGFTGSISCEFEGHHWFSDQDPLEQIRRYQALVRRCAGVEID